MKKPKKYVVFSAAPGDRRQIELEGVSHADVERRGAKLLGIALAFVVARLVI